MSTLPTATVTFLCTDIESNHKELGLQRVSCGARP